MATSYDVKRDVGHDVRDKRRVDKRRVGGIDITAALIAGLVAALVFLILEMALLPLLGVSALAPFHMIAAIVLGTEALAMPLTVGIVLTALVAHFFLSIIYAFIVGAFINERRAGPAVIIGLVFGLALYLINFFVFTGAFPWFAQARNWVSVVAHLAFGATAAIVYIRVEAGVARRGLRRQAV
ncbi:MAG: hypothetical protein ACNA8W_21540 [Bradymonadaceae bacterium]